MINHFVTAPSRIGIRIHPAPVTRKGWDKNNYGREGRERKC